MRRGRSSTTCCLVKGGWYTRPTESRTSGSFKDVIGPNIDTTNPEAAKWFWEKIRDRYVKPYGFDYIWLDETEPDIDPAKDVFFIGSGTRFYNVYPLFHTASVYEGFRRDFGDSRRVMILARAAYLGAQRNGTVFWSSDIVSTWDMLKRSIPAGLNFTATGLPYWDTDIAGFFSPAIPADYHATHKPLIDGSDVRDTIGNYEDYPELFVRWFEWGAFQPVMRAHGERNHNEVWSYGKQAEPILAKYLKLRYQLLPYTYSVAYRSYQTGAPYMRALFMDFPDDPKAANIPDEYMYGPAFLVAPVTEQGATQRTVYLPAGCDWYNYWTNERLHGGQMIVANAPDRHAAAVCESGKHRAAWVGGAERTAAADDRVSTRVSRSEWRVHALSGRRENLCLREGRCEDHQADVERPRASAET